MLHRFAAVDIPVPIGNGVRFGTVINRLQQFAERTFRLDAAVIRTVRTQLPE